MPGVLLSHRGRIGIGAVIALVAVLVLVMMRAAPAHGPDAPYDHEGLSEVSVATEHVVNGQASIVTDGLQSRGYWCVQPRSNDSSVQVACQSPGTAARSGDRFGHAAWVAGVVMMVSYSMGVNLPSAS